MTLELPDSRKSRAKASPLSLSGAAVPERGRLEEEEESEAEGRSSERNAKGAMARKHGWQLPAHTLQVQFPSPFPSISLENFTAGIGCEKKSNVFGLFSLAILFASGFHSSAQSITTSARMCYGLRGETRLTWCSKFSTRRGAIIETMLLEPRTNARL